MKARRDAFVYMRWVRQYIETVKRISVVATHKPQNNKNLLHAKRRRRNEEKNQNETNVLVRHKHPYKRSITHCVFFSLFQVRNKFGNSSKWASDWDKSSVEKVFFQLLRLDFCV